MEKKKEFQKVIKEIRAGRPYPKAMMTGQQERKGTATVNCGGAWKPSTVTREIAEEVIEDKAFQAFLARHSATAELEFVKQDNAWQIRIYFR